MAQHDFVIANQGFPATRADINSFLQAVASTHSGTTTPTGAVAGTIWLDTTSATAPILKYYDGTDNITLATIDHVANTVNFSDSALDLITDTTPELGGNLNVNTHSIVSTSNGNITLIPNGTGDVVLSADTVKIGDSNANATITTDGTGDLILNTNSGTNSGSITIADGANGNITIAGNGTAQIIVNAGAVGTPTIAPTGDLNTGIFFPSADTIAFTEGGTEAMRITSDGRLGIGVTTPTQLLSLSNGATPRLSLIDTRTPVEMQVLVDNTAGYSGTITAHPYLFISNSVERMRIDSAGGVLIGTTNANPYSSNTAGVSIGAFTAGEIIITRDNGSVVALNRKTSDGDLVLFGHDGVTEGSISVSGATVSYNGFTGSHWSRFIDESKPDVLRGTVLESLDQMIDWYHAEFEVSYTEQDKDGNDVVKTSTQKKPYALKTNEQEGDVITYNWNTEKKDEEGNDIIEQVQATIVKQKDVKHVMSKISDTSEAKNVYGVFSAWDNDDLINNDFYVASVGSYVVRIKAGQTVSKGDLLQSNGDGTAKVQADDIIRASTFAKVLSNTVIDTYEDGSFIVPCSLMC